MKRNGAMRHLAEAALLLSVMLFLATLSLTPVEAADTSSVHLYLGDQDSVPWSVGAIKPGDYGSEEVVLQNTGSRDGLVLLWISNIEETDAAGDGASLGQYMRFSIDAEGLSTEVQFPCTIYDLPEYPSSSNKIVVGPLPAGGSITLHWTWEFLETGAPQNEAQGDGLSFDINYLLYESPPAGEDYQWVLMEILGRETVVGVNSTGYALETVQARDPSGAHRITIPQGTRIVTEGGQIPSAIIMTVDADTAEGLIPDGWTAVGPAYFISGYLEGTGTVDVLFIGNVGLTLGLDPASVPEGTRATSIFMLTTNGDWARIGSSSSTSYSWEAWGTIDRTGAYAVLASEDASGQAFIDVSGLTVRPESSEIGWPIVLASSTGRTVAVGVTLTNHGDITGSCTILLIVDGKTRDSELVTLLPGESREIVLTASGLRDGDHQVRMAGLTGSFRTESTINWPAVLASVAVPCSLLVLTAIREKRARVKVPDAMMDEYKGRVLRELRANAASFAQISRLTRLGDSALLQVMEVLWEEGRLGAMNEGHTLYFISLSAGPAADPPNGDLSTSRTSGREKAS